MTNEYENPLIPTSPPPEADTKWQEFAEKIDKVFTAKWRDVVIMDDEYLNPTDKFEEPEWALTKDDIPCMSFADYHYIQGQKGNGKTFTFSIFEAAILGGKWGPLKYVGEKRPKPKVLHIDTEQSKGNVQLVKARVYHMVGWGQGEDHSDQYRILMLKKTTNPKIRWEKIKRACIDYLPDFVFIDGMLDVVTSMNDEEECSRVIGEAGALAETINAAVTGICHENPTSQDTALKGDTKPAGHQGSFSERKGASGFGTVKERKPDLTDFHVLEKKARNKDFGDFIFRIEDKPIEIDGNTYWIGIPYYVEPVVGGNDSNDDTPASPTDDPNLDYNMKRILDTIFNEYVDQFNTADFEDHIRNTVKQIGLSGGKGSAYTMEKVKEYFVSHKLVNVIDGTRGAKIFRKKIEDPF